MSNCQHTYRDFYDYDDATGAKSYRDSQCVKCGLEIYRDSLALGNYNNVPDQQTI